MADSPQPVGSGAIVTGATTMGAEGSHLNWCLRRFESCRCHQRTKKQRGEQLTGMEMTPTQEPVMTARADLVAILEELCDVLVRIDDGR